MKISYHMKISYMKIWKYHIYENIIWKYHTGNIILHLGDRPELDIFHLKNLWQFGFQFYRKWEKNVTINLEKKIVKILFSFHDAICV